MNIKKRSVNDRAAIVGYWICQKNEQGNYYQNRQIAGLVGEPDLTDADISKLVYKAQELGYVEKVVNLTMGDSMRRRVESFYLIKISLRASFISRLWYLGDGISSMVPGYHKAFDQL